MKRTIYTMVAAGVLCGCQQKPDPRDAQIKALEGRMAALESKLDAKIGEWHSWGGEFKSNVFRVNDLTLDTVKGIGDQLEEMGLLATNLLTQMAAMTNRPFASPTARYSPISYSRPATSLTKDGVPISVYNTIAAEAARKWASDFQMQAYEIKNQVEAYRKLHP